jgi:altronate dehydratase
VYQDAEPVLGTTRGYDPASATEHIAEGSDMLMSVTGLASGFEFPPSATKHTCDSLMPEPMCPDMDGNCGSVV